MYENLTMGTASGRAGTQIPSIAKCPIETIPEIVKSLHELSGALRTTSRNIADALGGSQPEPPNNGGEVSSSLGVELRSIRETIREALAHSDRARATLGV